ncbi:T9SS type A sorting domain-containing protein, partial [Candidatus Fermentibacteria bacterium]|nr:T9SS type A sorting domain-containing protein [Candidatus Fermentibacteria bacterium]
ADINGDGFVDLVAVSYADEPISWWQNSSETPGGNWTKRVIYEEFTTANSACTGDFNGDGYPDVASTSFANEGLYWWDNIYGTATNRDWERHTVSGNLRGGCSVCCVDMDGDGDQDLLAATYTRDDVIWYENLDGLGTSWTGHYVTSEFENATYVSSEDIDGDGDLDVIGCSSSINDVLWWENENGSGSTWTEHEIDADFDHVHQVSAADVNADGRMDVVGAAWGDGMTWWQNLDGSGTSWGERPIDEGFDGAYSVRTVDLDDDGDMDVIGCSVKTDQVMWWENDDGSGTLWIEHLVDGRFMHGGFVSSADVNSDGVEDILGAADIDSRLSWWALSPFVSRGILVSSVLDVAERPEWQYIDWTCSEPGLTSIAFQVRASDDPANLGAWSDTLTSPDSLSAILEDGDSLFQYKAILRSDYSYSTPVLHSVSVFWERMTGFGESPSGNSFELRGALPNPSSGRAIIEFSIPGYSRVEIAVYDLAGRLVSRTEDHYSAGTHRVRLEGLASGVYLVRMRAGEFTATSRFVVIE